MAVAHTILLAARAGGVELAKGIMDAQDRKAEGVAAAALLKIVEGDTA